MELTVATLNVRTSLGPDWLHSWIFRRSITVRALMDLDADVIALQEVRRGQLQYLRRKLPDYELLAIGRDDGRSKGEHLVMAVRRSLAGNVRVEGLWFTETPGVPGRPAGSRFNRFALYTYGLAVPVVNVHLEERSVPARLASIVMLAEWSPPDAVILGDFNCRIDDAALEPLWQAGWVDALAGLPAQGPVSATHHSFSGRVKGTRIDHILVPQGAQVTEARIVHDRPSGRLPSDHWPVVATVSLPVP